MADANTGEGAKKGGIVKIAIFALVGILLLVIGLALGYILFGGNKPTDPSSEVNEIIEKKNNTGAGDSSEGSEGEEGSVEEELECIEGEDGEEECVPKKKTKDLPEIEKFLTTYYEFPGNFTTNLKGSRKFLQVTVGVSTQYDDEVMVNVEDHNLALRSEILAVMSEFSEEQVSGRDGKKALAEALKEAINAMLEELEGFGGVEGVHFTSFVLQ